MLNPLTANEQIDENLENEPIEETPFGPKSFEDLRKELDDYGILSVESTESDGTPLVWTNAKIKKLFDDYKNGERIFTKAKYQTEDGIVERLETEMRNVRAHVYYTDEQGNLYKLYQMRTYAKSPDEVLDEDGNLRKEINTRLTRKKESSSISGKVKNKKPNLEEGAEYIPEALTETELLAKFAETIHAEMSEEMKLARDAYEIRTATGIKEEAQMSFGFPGLFTKFAFVEYSIAIKPEAFKEEFVEMTPIIDEETGQILDIPVNVFRWERV